MPLGVYYAYFPDWQGMMGSIWQCLAREIRVISSQWQSFHPGRCA